MSTIASKKKREGIIQNWSYCTLYCIRYLYNKMILKEAFGQSKLLHEKKLLEDTYTISFHNNNQWYAYKNKKIFRIQYSNMTNIIHLAMSHHFILVRWTFTHVLLYMWKLLTNGRNIYWVGKDPLRPTKCMVDKWCGAMHVEHQ